MDVTASRELANRLAAAEERWSFALRGAGLRYEAMRETNPGGFCVLSLTRRILEVNDTYCRQTGYSRAELERLSVPDLDATKSREQVEAHLRQIVEGKADRFETRQRRKDGQLWHVEVTASYSPVEGGRFFCFLHDITARKRDQRLAELRQRLLELLPVGYWPSSVSATRHATTPTRTWISCGRSSRWPWTSPSA
jgi:PAS domain S-box-containing protein